jgi:ATP-dependent DNA helicase RecQ
VATEHGGLALGGNAREILKGEATVAIALAPERRERRGRRGASGPPNPVGDPLFEALRALRRELATEAQVPPYVIFHDATLRDLAQARPASLVEMGTVPGIGAKKLEAYGPAFLAVIRQH